MNMNRRGFLASILAAGVAPAFVGSKILMPIRMLAVPVGAGTIYVHPDGLGVYPYNSFATAATSLSAAMAAAQAGDTLFVSWMHFEGDLELRAPREGICMYWENCHFKACGPVRYLDSVSSEREV